MFSIKKSLMEILIITIYGSVISYSLKRSYKKDLNMETYAKPIQIHLNLESTLPFSLFHFDKSSF